MVRLTNRGANFTATPLTTFNDLYQYLALTTSDANKGVYAKRFIDYLLSDYVQEKLYKINMFSPYIDVDFDIECLNDMQSYNNFLTISAFYPFEILGEIQNQSLSALKGNKNAINYVKNLLI